MRGAGLVGASHRHGGPVMTCRDDARLARDSRCGNAEIAENRAHAGRLSARSDIRSGQILPAFEMPILLDAARKSTI